ncbi:Golgi to ER traffic protein 4-like protein [Gossypium australe]|uniref:Golgi to ER traffic protein 4-like protein n=1 Tax=Gossypium australe TaxID=47621 RepID=A0A5B6UBA5_9ROSI|nr:Golgi to ER traffic protein 4-like protein [Gossypium australe]
MMVQLLDEIAEKFYGVQRRNPLQGMFGDLFKLQLPCYIFLFEMETRSTYMDMIRTLCILTYRADDVMRKNMAAT